MIIGWAFLFMTACIVFLIVSIIADYANDVRIGIAGDAGELVLVILMVIMLLLIGLLTGVGALASFGEGVTVISFTIT